jgi:hypothetical protein
MLVHYCQELDLKIVLMTSRSIQLYLENHKKCSYKLQGFDTNHANQVRSADPPTDFMWHGYMAAMNA